MIKFVIKILNKYKMYVKFIISGGSAALTHLIILATLTEVFQIYYLISAGIGYFFSFAVSFSLQKFWTFRDKNRDRLPRQALMFFAVTITGLFINTGMMYALVEWVGIHYLISQIITGGTIAVINFMVYRLIIFKKNEQNLETNARDNKHGKKKLLIATPIFPPVIGGAATYVKTLCEELPQNGFEVTVITYGREVKSEKLKVESNIEYINKNQGMLKKYWQFFWAMFKEADSANAIYIMDPINAGLPAALACYLRAKDYFIKIVGDYAWEHAQECHGVTDRLDNFQTRKYNKKIELIRWLQKRIVKGARQIITPSYYLKDLISGWEVDGDKIKVIYNAVKEANIRQTQAEAKEELGLLGNTVISVGRLLPWKGFDALIDLVPEIVRVRPDYILVIIGEGPEQRHISEKVKACPEQSHIRFIPGLEQRKLWEYMRGSDVFILNTGYEGLPHIVIEAQMLGLPVITTPAGGNTEVVKGGENGLLVEYNNKEEIKSALLDLLNNKDKGLKLAMKAQAGIDKFSREKMIREVVRVLGR